MATRTDASLVIHSRVSPWGFIVALTLALCFVLGGVKAIEQLLLPRKFGVFVDPPHWLIGALLLAFAVFLFLIGVSELARYVKPATEVVIDRDGIATIGLLGERRFAWRDVLAAELTANMLSLKVRGNGRLPPPDLRIHFDRLDVEPATILARIRDCRADLAPASRLEA